MVDVEEQGGEKHLRSRISKLTKELDQLDVRYTKVCEAFRGAVGTLASLAQDQLGKNTAKTLEKLKKQTMAKPLSPPELQKAVDGFKTALMADPQASAKPEKNPEAEGAGKHVVMALLAGLRMGERAFDTKLDQAISTIGFRMEKGQVRPAMVELADLLDNFREVLVQRREKAEAALQEVLQELLATEEEFSKAFMEANDGLTRAGRDYDASVTASVGRLAKQVGEAKDLDTLKKSVVEHVRSLRETMRDRRAKEHELFSETRSELERMKSALSLTKERMQQVEKLSEKLSQEALTDPMTQILNKRAFSRSLAEALSKEVMWPFCLIVFDIDHFKTVNDNFGHQAGDKALKSISEYSSKVLRKNDTLFRYAGDEFCIILVKTQLKEAAEVAERVREATSGIKFTWKGERGHNISVSMGLSQAKKGDTAEALFKRADEFLLEAKRQGRNRVVYK